jgi:type I restriction enzyme S subunit
MSDNYQMPKNGWKECKLGDVAQFKNGKSRPSEIVNGTIPIYGGNGILGYTDTFNYQGETVIVGRVGAYCGSVFFENKPIWVSDNALYTIPKNETDAKFLYYLLKNMGLNSQAEGSSHPLLTQTLLNSLDVFVTEFLPEQRAIAGVLSSLDDKIDLLHRQNKTLERMAEALWRKTFVEEADPGWREGKFGDEMSITMGQSPPGNTYNERKQGIVFFQGRAEFDFRFPQTRLYCSEPKRLAKKGDTLVSVRAPVGDINMAYEDCCIGRGLAAVRHKGDCTSYTFYKTCSLKGDFDSFEQQGTVFGSIGKDDFNNITTRVPSGEAVKEFEHAARPIDDKIFTNSIQIRTLSRLRDTLLPKLMSGEVRVKL